MRLARDSRELSGTEIMMARDVFEDSLPAWRKILITDGLGPIPGYDNPYTEEVFVHYFLNLGPEVFPDAALARHFNGFGAHKAILIHEMTHVWQLYHGYWVTLRSAWANSRLGAGYNYTVGGAWDDYNVEQQAHLVEDWFMGGQSETDDRFVYIDKIIRPGVGTSPLSRIIINLSPDELRKL